MQSCSVKTKPAQYWKIIKSLNGNSAVKNVAINFGHPDRLESKPKAIAQGFNKMFGTVVRHRVTKAKKKATWKLMQDKPLIDAPVFAVADVRRAILDMRNSKAEGPDGLTILQFKQLGPLALAYLTAVLNMSVSASNIPAMWKTSHVVPIAKPGKDPSMAASYRPVSLLCPAAKILEKLLLPIPRAHLPLSHHQHGFRQGHSTTTALMKIVKAAGDGFNRRLPHPDRTLVVALDLTKAFDSLDHSILIRKMAASSLPNTVVRWVANYLHGRVIKTCYKDSVSAGRLLKVGSPQGSIISPHLFNYYVADLPIPPAPLQLVSYADDITVFGTGDWRAIQGLLNAYLPSLRLHLRRLHLSISAAKSSVTMLTIETHQIGQMERLVNVAIGNDKIPVVRNPKILGLTFDPMLRFGLHADTVNSRVRRNTNIIKALASSRVGQSKECMVVTYKATGRALLDYAAPVWSPNVRPCHWRKLQAAQNAALRVVTGCHKIASEDHLHTETRMVKAEEHANLLSAQFLASCYDGRHPCHELSRPRDRLAFPREIYTTIGSRHRQWVEGNMVFDPGGEMVPQRTRAALHTRCVEASLAARGYNRVLGARPPGISDKEKRLPRQTRCLLSQLRSGFSIYTNDFRSIISNVPNVCPECGGSPHDVRHLFSCPARRTVLTVLDLWRRPIQAARFVKNLIVEEA